MMRNLLFVLVSAFVWQSAQARNCSANHAYEFSLNHELVRIEFGKLPDLAKTKPEHFEANLNFAVREALATIDKIKRVEKPDFTNVVIPLERALQKVAEIKDLFDAANLEQINEYLPHSAGIERIDLAYKAQVFNDAGLFRLLKGIDQRSLPTEEQRLMKVLFTMFKEQGLDLSPADRKIFARLQTKLGDLYTAYMSNIISFNAKTKVIVTDIKELEGVPADIVATMAATAKAENIDGWVLPLNSPSMAQLRTYAQSEVLRKKIFETVRMRVFESEHGDNSKVVFAIGRLRDQYAKLLGYRSFAELAIEDRMIGSPANVNKMTRELIAKYKPAALREDAELHAFVKEKTGQDIIEPWDRGYYTNLLLKERFAFDGQKIREYLPAERVRAGLFKVIHDLWGISIIARHDIPTQLPDMVMFEVKARDGETLGFMQFDPYSRNGKKAGAWMAPVQFSAQSGGPRVPGFVKVVTNIAKPAEGQPVLMSVDQAITLFHEFGHAIHFLASKAKYSMLGGTNTKHDFVELPSQLLENFFRERSVFQEIARHHKTGEPIPTELLDAMDRAANFQSGLAGLARMQQHLLDMAWNEGRIHNRTEPLWKIENDVVAEATLRPPRYNSVLSTSFTHILFGSVSYSPKQGYGGGYYSYKYAEILEAQAFEVFKKNGIFDRATADRYLRTILEVGDTVDPLTAFRNFVGADPSPEAMLKREGIQ